MEVRYYIRRAELSPPRPGEMFPPEVQEVLDTFEDEYVQRYFSSAVKEATRIAEEKAMETADWQETDHAIFNCQQNNWLSSKWDRNVESPLLFEMVDGMPSHDEEYYVSIRASVKEALEDDDLLEAINRQCGWLQSKRKRRRG